MKILKNIKIKHIFLSIIIFFISANIFCFDCFGAISPQIQQISKIEQNIWGFEYQKDDSLKRLTRIEKNIFGSVNSSSDINSRIKKINEALGLESYEDSKKQGYELSKTEINGINYPQIDKLEYQLFQETYERENIYTRLDRLEKKIFGAVQSGNLASRTDALNTYLKPAPVAKNPNYYTQQPYSPTKDIESYMGSQNKYENSDVYIQLAGLETALFSKTYSQDPVELRLNRLERKIFQRDFSSDDDYLRLQRLQAAANAQKTARLYEANKMQKYTSTGIQFGSILLMILALIL